MYHLIFLLEFLNFSFFSRSALAISGYDVKSLSVCDAFDWLLDRDNQSVSVTSLSYGSVTLSGLSVVCSALNKNDDEISLCHHRNGLCHHEAIMTSRFRLAVRVKRRGS